MRNRSVAVAAVTVADWNISRIDVVVIAILESIGYRDSNKSAIGYKSSKNKNIFSSSIEGQEHRSSRHQCT